MAVDDRRRTAPRHLSVATWRGDQSTVVVNPSPDRSPPTADAIASLLDDLQRRGHARVLTGALHDRDVEPFVEAGFEVHETLHLLSHDLRSVPEPSLRSSPRLQPLRRGRRRDRPGILEVDAAAFDDFWKLDSQGLDDAIRATPAARVRVIGRRGERVVAYSVTGRAGGRGYVQRLAVHPDRQRRGIGVALVSDSLRWLIRRGAHEALVNTQEHNAPALELYLRCGFTPEPTGLTVLTYELSSSPAAQPPPSSRQGSDER